MIRMIVMDLDGTLLDHDKNISARTLSVLETCGKKGIKIVLATARGPGAAKRCGDLVRPDYLILNSGALTVTGDGAVVHRQFLSAGTTDGILGECVAGGDTGGITVETENNYYVSFTEPNHPDYASGVYYDFKKPLNQRAYKITVEIHNDDSAAKIAEKFPEAKMITFFGEPWRRFAHAEAEKMAAVKIIAGLEKIPLSETASFGDDLVDLEMIRGCGFGVAMGNAACEVKKAAGYICGTNGEDGVAKWLEQYAL